MEEKARELPPAPANAEAAPPVETLAEAPRRRAGGQKRKAAYNSNSTSTPSKRPAKDRNPHHLLPPVHNGPCTRARQSPNKPAAAAPQKQPEATPAPVAAADGRGKEISSAGCPIEADDEELVQSEQPVVDPEFDAVRSRGGDVHVVPTHAGWFSWNKIHPLEEHALASFFNGKSEKRTSDIYMEMRNTIMKKFHADPQTQVELKDLSELSVGELDARQEVMEFLDHWGLINFHPFPPSNPDTSITDADRGATSSPLIKNLYQFEVVPSCPRLVPPRKDLTTPAMLPRLLPESTIADDLVRPEGPSVEYHCNSCSADCSRKRYHCQKQADFDLCTACYNDGKFGSGMAPTDFILMEPAEVPGVTGGSWTDQETLLLLEALEIYQENWNEIAEHVATKTKAQCILHFLQMPIEDPFLEGKDDLDDKFQEKIDPSTTKDSTAIDVCEKKEIRSTEDGELPVSSPVDASRREDAGEVEVSCEASASIIIDALKTAFQAVGYLPEQAGLLSFAEAGNPVMALAAFLAGVVESDVATTSFRSSLKAMSEDSPGIQLATRHCFVLDDPPVDRKDPSASESGVTDMTGAEVLKVEDRMPLSEGNDEMKDCTDKNKEDKGNDEMKDCTDKNKEDKGNDEMKDCTDKNKEDKGNDEMKDCTDKNKEDTAPAENEKDLSVSSQECSQKPCTAKESVDLTSSVEAAPSAMNESDGLSLPGEQIMPSTVKDIGDPALPGVLTPNDAPEPRDLALQGDAVPSRVKEINDLDLAAEDKPNSEKKSGDVDSLEEVQLCSDTSKAVDTMPNFVPLEDKESQKTAGSSSTAETGEKPGEDHSKVPPSNCEKNCNSAETMGDHNINRLKRAATTALSAAVVKAKLLANEEEEQIRQLVALVIEKQLHKLETKLAFFAEFESVIMRVREQMDRARHRLLQERAQIIAARYGLPTSSSRATPPSIPTGKIAMSYGTTGSKPLNMGFQKPPPMRRQ